MVPTWSGEAPRPRETPCEATPGEQPSGGQSPAPPTPTQAEPSASSCIQFHRPTREGPLPLGVVLESETVSAWPMAGDPPVIVQGSAEPGEGPGQELQPHHRSSRWEGAANGTARGRAKPPRATGWSSQPDSHPTAPGTSSPQRASRGVSWPLRTSQQGHFQSSGRYAIGLQLPCSSCHTGCFKPSHKPV